MAKMNKIQSFKTFSQLKAEEKEIQLQEEAKGKREQLVTKIGETLAEMDITSFDELSEEQKKALVAKLFNEESEVEITTKGDAELEINREEKVEEAHKKLHGPLHQLYKKVGSKKFIEAVGLVMSGADIEFTIKTAGEKIDDYYDIEEGNAFIYAAAKAKQAGESEFEFKGKTYKVTLKADVGLKESYNLLITEGTRWQFGIIDKAGNIKSNYVHFDGYPSSVIPQIKGMDAKQVRNILKDSEMGGMRSLKEPYNDSQESTITTGTVKNIKKYLKDIENSAGAEYVYLFDEKSGKWVGADTYVDKALKPVDQIEESVVTEKNFGLSKLEDMGFKAGEDYFEKVKGLLKNGPDLKAYKKGFTQGFVDNAAAYGVKESVVNEAEVKSDEDFKEYAETVLKKAFGEDYDEAKAGEVIDGLTSKYSGDYGAMVGALQSSLD